MPVCPFLIRSDIGRGAHIAESLLIPRNVLIVPSNSKPFVLLDFIGAASPGTLFSCCDFSHFIIAGFESMFTSRIRENGHAHPDTAHPILHRFWELRYRGERGLFSSQKWPIR